MRDANGVVIGTLVGVTNTGVTVLNSGGYLFEVFWNGQVANRQTYFASADCTGATAAINGGGTAGLKMYGKTVIRSSTGQFYKIASFNSNLEATSATGLFTKNSIDNLAPSNCGVSSATAANGWLLTAINSTDVGIPATIVPPLQIP